MTYRNDLDALGARHTALEAELAAKTKELDAATRLLEEAELRAKLPVLDNIRVASPCRADWSAMVGDERVRACGSCDKHVYNLSAMTRDEAQALIIERNGKLCVRYYRRSDGTIILADCTVGAAAARKRKWIAAAAVAMLASGSAVVVHATRHPDDVRMDAIVMSPDVEPTTEHVTGNVHEPQAAPPEPELRATLGELELRL